nr:deoxyguanosinetriphosphate triphosphohydrolase [Pseudarthrobacter oxydans]
MLYSEAFRRLGGVTQVALGTPTMALHNRLTHSLKVEQVGVSIFSYLKALSGDHEDLDEDAIAAACLAHDLGHPPFGHAGEEALDALVVCAQHRQDKRPFAVRKIDPCNHCKLEDGFEGNAQSLRIIAVLAVHRDSADAPLGLDLTRASLAATIKYPWLRNASSEKPKKWGAYDCDAEILKWATGADIEVPAKPTLNAQVMDWADDISYAVHDIEDFYRSGQIPLDDYKAKTHTLAQFLEYAQTRDALGQLSKETTDAFDGLCEFFPRARFAGQTEDLARLDRLRGFLLGRFIPAVRIEGSDLMRVDPDRVLIELLQQLIWFHIIHEPTLANIQIGQQRVLREIFHGLEEVATNAYHIGGASDKPDAHSLRRLPYGLTRTIEVSRQQESNYTQSQRIYRGILDYIAGLSDSEAYHLHAVLKGREYAGHL